LHQEFISGAKDLILISCLLQIVSGRATKYAKTWIKLKMKTHT